MSNKRKAGVPYKSTTHEEMFFHLELTFVRSGVVQKRRVTVFARLEHGMWESSAAICNPLDNYSKSLGRSRARRRYFQGRIVGCQNETPTHKSAINDAKIEIQKSFRGEPLQWLS